jgi:hypothetical protein
MLSGEVMHFSTPAMFSLLVLLGACGGSTTAQSPVVERAEMPASRDLGDIDDDHREVDPAPRAGFFVWTRDAEGRAQTHRLDTAGREVETLDGVFIATPAGSWQWSERDLPIATSPCERYDEEGGLIRGSEEPGLATRAVLANTVSGDEQGIVEAPPDADGAEEFQQSVELVGSVGPLLFVRQSTYVYTCGAHGTTRVAAIIWDASTGSRTALPVDVGSLGRPRAEALRALAEDGDEFPATDETMDLTEIVPSLARDGSLKLGLQFTAPTCYACTHGGAGSYTKSTIVDADRLSDALGGYAKAPAAVRGFLATYPEAEVKGWSAMGEVRKALTDQRERRKD